MSRSKSWARGAVLSVAALVIGLGLAACGGGDDGGGGGPKVALLLPETKTTRYEAHDQPEFEAAMNAACPDCELIYSNANQDAAHNRARWRPRSPMAPMWSPSTPWTRHPQPRW